MDGEALMQSQFLSVVVWISLIKFGYNLSLQTRRVKLWKHNSWSDPIDELLDV